MQILGMPSGACRKPLGKMTRKGLDVVVRYLAEVMENNPELLAPVEAFFGVDIKARLADESLLEGLVYTETY